MALYPPRSQYIIRDTVSSVGVVRNKVLPYTADGMKHVCYFRHALALDEKRVKFLPEYAYAGATQPATVDTAETVKYTLEAPHTKEVWFRGSHSDMCAFSISNLDSMGLSIFQRRWKRREHEAQSCSSFVTVDAAGGIYLWITCIL